MRPTPGPARQLPIPVPPSLHETVESYLRRLAAVNHIPVSDLKSHLGLDPQAGAETLSSDSLTRLAILTGTTTARLIRALPELDRRHRDPDLFRPTQNPACTGCTRRHRGGPIRQFHAYHVHVCPQHRLWLIGSSHYRRSLLDISPAPAVLAAQRRHRRLALRYGPRATSHAYTTARRLWDHFARTVSSDPISDILGLLCPGRTRFLQSDPEYLAATYPIAVTVTALLVSPHWRALAEDLRTREQFLAELGSRLHGERYYWLTGQDPLHEWIDDMASRDNRPHRHSRSDEHSTGHRGNNSVFAR